MTPSLIALDHISKRFGATQALTDVSFNLQAGTVHALLGENGAGKTTLMRIAYGLIRADRGSVSFHGRSVRVPSPAAALRLGVGMVHQHFALVRAMTVSENIALSMEGPYRPAQLRRQVNDLAGATGLLTDPDARVGTLSVAAQQRVEILKALIRSVRVLILDEPTAVLPPNERVELLTWIRKFASKDRAVVLITHKLDEARSVADEITVLRAGRAVLSASNSQVSATQLVHAMLGASISDTEPVARKRVGSRVAARAHGVWIRDDRGIVRVRNATFEIRAGEITGVAGVEGSGHHELLRVLAGRVRPNEGKMVLPERIAYAPDDRLRDALIPDATLSENFALYEAVARRGLMHWRSIERLIARLLVAYDVRVPSSNAKMATLSGGNQQKFVFLRELSEHPDLLIAVNPTRGLDVRASTALQARLQSARDDGAAVVIYSSDLDELLALSDRILVVHGGEVAEVATDRELIGRAMVGTT